MRRFYVEIASLNVNSLALPVEESKHACRVLRMKEGDQMEVVNGKGELFTGSISAANPKKCIVEQVDYEQWKQDTYHIHVAIAPTKMNDRFETFLEKATELGIHEITPLLCSNSERKKIKLDRYYKVLIAAMKQSKRLYLPQLNPLTSFNEFVKQNTGLIAHCEDGIKGKTEELLRPSDSPIIIGPEGDFTPQEISLALENDFKPITLGKTRLRTETAGLYACMLAKHKFES
jgi:16S rRNA (uracil1498-N3)-methyltransferase